MKGTNKECESPAHKKLTFFFITRHISCHKLPVWEMRKQNASSDKLLDMAFNLIILSLFILFHPREEEMKSGRKGNPNFVLYFSEGNEETFNKHNIKGSTTEHFSR